MVILMNLILFHFWPAITGFGRPLLVLAGQYWFWPVGRPLLVLAGHYWFWPFFGHYRFWPAITGFGRFPLLAVTYINPN
jgi:hypothetical protein